MSGELLGNPTPQEDRVPIEEQRMAALREWRLTWLIFVTVSAIIFLACIGGSIALHHYRSAPTPAPIVRETPDEQDEEASLAALRRAAHREMLRTEAQVLKVRVQQSIERADSAKSDYQSLRDQLLSDQAGRQIASSPELRNRYEAVGQLRSSQNRAALVDLKRRYEETIQRSHEQEVEGYYNALRLQHEEAENIAAFYLGKLDLLRAIVLESKRLAPATASLADILQHEQEIAEQRSMIAVSEARSAATKAIQHEIDELGSQSRQNAESIARLTTRLRNVEQGVEQQPATPRQDEPDREAYRD